MRLPELVAHRGYPRHYPENTLTGIAAAIAAGARYVEIDVQLSADEAPVLFHDDTLERVCGARGAVHDYRLAELERFRATEFGRFGYKFAQEPVATLARFAALLARHPRVTAFVEVKTSAVARFGNALVLARLRAELAPVLGQCVLISYGLDTLAHARAQDWPALGAVIDRWRDWRQDAITRDIRPEYLFCDVAGLPRLGRLRVGNARVAVFEVVDARLALALASRGVDLVETFAIGELRAELELLAAGA